MCLVAVPSGGAHRRHRERRRRRLVQRAQQLQYTCPSPWTACPRRNPGFGNGFECVDLHTSVEHVRLYLSMSDSSADTLPVRRLRLELWRRRLGLRVLSSGLLPVGARADERTVCRRQLFGVVTSPFLVVYRPIFVKFAKSRLGRQWRFRPLSFGIRRAVKSFVRSSESRETSVQLAS